ncbi:MAG TPA: hypothetical protein VE641_21760 [Chthoniobacterales bacterium]|nr:hypothetical protein [Chthoniobacterales bacterium]
MFTLTGHQSLGLIASLDVLAIPALIAVGAFTAYSLVIALLALPPLTDKPEAEAVRLRGRFSLVWRKPESKIVAARVIAAVAASLCSSFG